VCPLFLRYGLPCRHILVYAYLKGIPLPKSIFYRRWWINGPEIIQIGSTSITYEETTLPISPPRPQPTMTTRNILTSGGLQVLAAAQDLDPIERVQYEQAVLQAHQNLLNIADFLRTNRLAPAMIEQVPKKRWLKPKKEHGKSNERALTRVEMAEREANLAEKARGKSLAKASQAQIQGSTIEVAVPVQTLLKEDSIEEEDGSSSASEGPPNLPPSTAPPRIEREQGSGKRARANTGYYTSLTQGDSQGIRQKRAR
jgi:hypothetical protein